MRKIGFLFMSLALLFSFIVMPSNALASTNQDYFTVDGYEQYLQDLILKDENSAELASEGLGKFKKLSKEEKKLFVDFLNSEYYFESLEEVLSPTDQSVKASVTDSTRKEFVIQFKGQEIPISYEMDEGVVEDGIVPYANHTTQVEALYTMYVFGIKTTVIGTTLKFVGNGYRALSILDAYQSHVNINPGVWMSYGTANTYISDRYAHVRATYELRSTGSLGFISANLHHTVRAAWSQNKQHKLDSTHINIKSFGWTNF